MGEEVSATGEALGVLSKFIGWVSHRLGRRIKIKEIKRKSDSDIHDALDLYERLFKDEFRVYPAELTAWLRAGREERNAPNALQHCLLIAKRQGKVVALLKAIYCPETRWAFIAYFGVDKNDLITRKVASKILTTLFRKYVFKRWKNCRGVAFEIESPTIGISKEQKIECKARLRLFRDIARHQGHRAFEVKIDYHQPMMADAPVYRGTGRKMSLMVILTKGCDTQKCEAEEMSRVKAEQLLTFLFFRIYAGTQDIPAKKHSEYKNHLAKIHQQVLASIKDSVELET